MRFFMYNEQVVNLAHVTNFHCFQKHVPHQGEDKEFSLVAELDYSHGITNETNYGAGVDLGKFKTKAEGLEVAQDILAGMYDVATLQPGTGIVEPETTEQPTEQEGEQQSEQPSEQPSEQTKDPKALEEAKEKAREVFKHQQTKTISTELGITTLTVYNTAQDIWGKSNTWDIKGWETYLIGLADFQQRKGVLYDKLKPSTENEETQKNNGATQTKNGDGPF